MDHRSGTSQTRTQPAQTDAPDALRILLIEDNPADVVLIRRMLAAGGPEAAEITVVNAYADAADALKQPFDICLMDYELGAYTALELLRRTGLSHLPGPVILLTGHDDLTIDAAALDIGVADFLTKQDITPALLDRTIRYARRQFADKATLRHMATHDTLTGLLNRHAFLSQLEQWFAEPDTRTRGLYLIYVDLDNFKAINDTWGHDRGDAALRHAAGALKNCLAGDDLVARYGGDELIAAVRRETSDDIGQVADTINQALRRPIGDQPEPLVVTASLGVAHAEQAPGDLPEVVRLADHAMFAAKQAGRDTWRLYSDALPLAARNRGALGVDLRAALDAPATHGLWQHYEAHVETETGRIAGAEALARWDHPERGRIAPSEFLPVVHEAGLIRPFTQWSLRQALDALAGWRSAGLLADRFRMGVNLAPAQLLEAGFPDTLARLLSDAAVPAHHLRLEITEDVLLIEHAAITDRLERLRRMGVSLALDDLGVGHSALTRLVHLPIDTLKIDLDFTTGMLDDPRSAALVRVILTLGRELDMTVIAEGVETQAQADLLLQYGCRLMQGYRFVSGDRSQFTQHLRDQHTGSA